MILASGFKRVLFGALLLVPVLVLAQHDPDIVVGSKVFTESVILGEIVARLPVDGVVVEHKKQLGGSRILFEALGRGDIDVYAEYSGTLLAELVPGARSIEDALRGTELRATPALGFDNTYVLAVRQSFAEQHKLASISDLVRLDKLNLGFGHEFINRPDGWFGLQERYGLTAFKANGLDHDLAYRAIASGDIDVMDAYSTDADIQHYELAVLADDLGYFPEYHAFYLYRQELEVSHPEFVAQLRALGGRINDEQMREMNAQVKLNRQSESRVAAGFLGVDSDDKGNEAFGRILQRTREHLVLVSLSLFAAIALAIPLAVWSVRSPRLGQVILSAAAILQTVPSLALFVFLIPLFGIGFKPAVVALFIYSVLPILRNAHSGLSQIPRSLLDSAKSLNLSPGFRLWRIELPLARANILAGVKTAAVINVGTATLAALIGAGGYGQPIITGIRLDDMPTILEGAAPAALMALLLQFGFDLLEKRLDRFRQ